MDDQSIYSLIGSLGSLAIFHLVMIFLGDLKGVTREGALRFGKGILRFIYLTVALESVLASAIYLSYLDGKADDDLIYGFLIVLFFFIVTIYMTVEYLTVKGTYTADGIDFYTLWTGRKTERWADIESVVVDSSWYQITFTSGKIIRLSHYLAGVDEVIALLEERGHKIT